MSSSEITELTKLATRLYDGPMWYGGNLKSVLDGITWQQAYIKPGGASHNIYEIIMHMNAWRRFVVEHLKGNLAYSLEMNTADDWVTDYAPTEQNWLSALETLVKLHTDLVALIPTVPIEQLTEKVGEKKFSWYVFLHGVIHHDIYHIGQVAILKRIAR